MESSSAASVAPNAATGLLHAPTRPQSRQQVAPQSPATCNAVSSQPADFFASFKITVPGGDQSTPDSPQLGQSHDQAERQFSSLLSAFDSKKPTSARRLAIESCCVSGENAAQVLSYYLTCSSADLQKDAMQLTGWLISHKPFVRGCPDDQLSKILEAVLAVLGSTEDKLTAKLALWGLSRQQLPATVCTKHGVSLIAAITPALDTSNRWGSFECVSFAAAALVKIGDRCWAVAEAHCGDWLRPCAALLLATPPPEHFELAGVQARYSDLRELVATTLLRWLEGGGATEDAAAKSLLPLPSALETAFASDVATKLAPQAKEVMQAVTEPRLRPHVRDGGASPSALRALEASLATSAVTACGIYFRFLGASAFAKKIGQPLLDILSKAFQHNTFLEIPVAAFGAWQRLAAAGAASGLLTAKAKLLVQPLVHAVSMSKHEPATTQVRPVALKLQLSFFHDDVCTLLL